jgi:hypothetical protein
MYTYRKREMTERDKEATLIGLTIRAMVEFQKIHAQRVAECPSPKWQQILQDVKKEVTEALLKRTDLLTIMAYTRELKNMDVSEFFPADEPQDNEQSSKAMADEAIGRAMQPQGRFYHMRKRARVWVNRAGSLVSPSTPSLHH